MIQQRKIWVDWAKVLGMYAIIYGHCFPETMSNFIYAFNVPVFFIISGYLCKKEQDFSTCWNKTLHNLIIPYYILAFIKVAGAIFKHLDDGQWIWSTLAVLGGFHTLNDAAGCSNLWFVYSLIIIKLVYQTAGKKTNLLLCILCIAGAWMYNQYLNIELRWAVADCMLAFPFFLLGRYISQNEYLKKTCSQLCHLSWGGKWMLAGFTLFLFVATYFIGEQNGQAKMYMNLYGYSLIWFAIAAITGSAAVIGISFLMDKADCKFVRVISSGTIVILVFHRELLHPMLKWISQQNFDAITSDALMALSAVIVLAAFYPLILIVKRVFPIVLGRRMKS